MDLWTRSIFVVCSLVLLFVLVGCDAQTDNTVGEEGTDTQQPILPAAEQLVQDSDERSPGDLDVETFCSLIEIRTSNARLTWEGNPNLADQQRIDVTVFKQGFEKDIYGTIDPISRQEVELQAPDLQDPDLKGMTAITGLRIEDVTYDKELEQMSMTVAGPEAGLIYYWRLLTLTDNEWVSSEIARSEAPVCVADFVDES